MNPILYVKNVTKYYGSGNIVTKALDGITFSVENGEFLAIMGASGSGKSTLLNVIATIDTVSSGEVRIQNKSLQSMKEDALSRFRRDQLGFIFQDYNLLDTLTIAENIVLPLNLKREKLQETEARLNKCAAALDITKQLSKFPYELSGGQRQRAACARALITDPALILADEPTGALDSKNSKMLMETFQMMNQSFGSTILMVTHDPVVGSYARRVIFLKDGKVWSEFSRGSRSRKQMYSQILTVTASMGGETDVF